MIMSRTLLSRILIFRPGELAHLGLYDMISQCQLKKMTREKLESGNVLVESKTTLI